MLLSAKVIVRRSRLLKWTLKHLTCLKISSSAKLDLSADHPDCELSLVYCKRHTLLLSGHTTCIIVDGKWFKLHYASMLAVRSNPSEEAMGSTPSIACIGVIGKHVKPLTLLVRLPPLISVGQSFTRCHLSPPRIRSGRPSGLLIPSQRLAGHVWDSHAKPQPSRSRPRHGTGCRRASQYLGLGNGHGHEICSSGRHVGQGRETEHRIWG